LNSLPKKANSEEIRKFVLPKKGGRPHDRIPATPAVKKRDTGDDKVTERLLT